MSQQELVFAALRVSSELESLLRARGGVGGGLGSLVKSLGEELPVELRSRLLALSVIRNKFVHQPDALPLIYLERFITEADDCREHLLALQGGEEQMASGVEDNYRLTRALRERETLSSFSPPPTLETPVLDVLELDRPQQRRLVWSSLMQLLAVVVFVLVFVLVLRML